MFNTKLSSAFILVATLASCGGGGGSGSSAETDKVMQTNKLEALISGNEISDKSDYYAGDATLGEVHISVDPKARNYEANTPDGGQILGEFDPKSGQVKFTDCTETQAYKCQNKIGNSLDFYKAFSNFSGGDYVIIGRNGDYAPQYLAVNPTSPDSLPKGTITYNGETDLLLISTADRSSISDRGDAKTTVNFDSGIVDAEFDNFGGPHNGVTASLNGSKINGAEFSGGDISINNNGTVWANDATQAYGHFYGPKGEELGGTATFGEEGVYNGYLAWRGNK